jgi:predicted nucleic acid-binding protein
VSYLLDTNILLRLAKSRHPMHRLTRDSVASLTDRREILYIVPQNLYEGWVVATRPLANNGLGLSPQLAARLIARTPSFCELIPDVPAIYAEWLELVRTYAVSGVTAHDARLVAAMKVHRIENLLTFNTADFSRFSGVEINVHSPESVLAS